MITCKHNAVRASTVCKTIDQLRLTACCWHSHSNLARNVELLQVHEFLDETYVLTCRGDVLASFGLNSRGRPSGYSLCTTFGCTGPSPGWTRVCRLLYNASIVEKVNVQKHFTDRCLPHLVAICTDLI
jgi:hypothetical protein